MYEAGKELGRAQRPWHGRRKGDTGAPGPPCIQARREGSQHRGGGGWGGGHLAGEWRVPGIWHGAGPCGCLPPVLGVWCGCGKDGSGGEVAHNRECLFSRPTLHILCVVLGAALCKGGIATSTYTQCGEGVSHSVIRATTGITSSSMQRDLEGT